MKKKVSIREIVASKIVIAILVAAYYWWCSRSDFNLEHHNFVSNWIIAPSIALLAAHWYRVQKYKKESFDELAEKNLQRCDAICLKVFVVSMVVAAFVGGIYSHIYPAISAVVMGWVIIGTVIAITIVRTIMFIVMDSKGA